MIYVAASNADSHWYKIYYCLLWVCSCISVSWQEAMMYSAVSYNTVNCLQNPHNRHTTHITARPGGRDIGVSLTLNQILVQTTKWCMESYVTINRVTTAPHCTRLQELIFMWLDITYWNHEIKQIYVYLNGWRSGSEDQYITPYGFVTYIAERHYRIK